MGHDINVCQYNEKTLNCCIKYLPDVVLLELGFALRSDGLRVAREIKACSLMKQVTVIALTGFSDNETRTLAKEAGCDHYFVKPADLDELQQLLNTIQASLVFA